MRGRERGSQKGNRKGEREKPIASGHCQVTRGLVGWWWQQLPQSHPACGFASSFSLSLSLAAQNHSAPDSSGFQNPRGLPGHLAVPEAPGSSEPCRMCASPRVSALSAEGSAAGWPGRKPGKAVPRGSLLKMLTGRQSTLGKCSERFCFQCPHFSGFGEVLLSREKVLLSPPSSPVV